MSIPYSHSEITDFNEQITRAILETAREYYEAYNIPVAWITLRRRYSLRVKGIPFPDYMEELRNRSLIHVCSNVNLKRWVMRTEDWNALGPRLQTALRIKLDAMIPSAKPRDADRPSPLIKSVKRYNPNTDDPELGASKPFFNINPNLTDDETD